MTTPTIDIAIGREFSGKVIPLINNAKKSINVMVYDWNWYPDQIGSQIQIFNNAIVRAKQRGLDVKAVVFRKNIFNILRDLGIKVKWVGESKTLHVKLMIIDNQIVILGSHNYTKSAFDINYEASVIIYDEKAAEKFFEFFSTFCY